MAYLHSLFFILLLGSWLLIIYQWFKAKSSGIEQNPVVSYQKTFLIINSAVAYALAYNSIFFIQELFLVLGKNALGLTAYLYHNNHSWEGTDPRTDLMQGSGAAAIFITGIICALVLTRIKKSSSWIRILLVWLTFHGFIQSLPQIPSGVLAPTTDVGRAMDYLGLSQELKLFLSTICILGIILIAIRISGILLQLAPTSDVTSTSRRRFQFLLYSAFLPALLGAVLIIPFRILPWSQIISPFIIAIMAIPWILVGGMRTESKSLYQNVISEKLLWGPIIFLILLLAFFQLVLAPGVKF